MVIRFKNYENSEKEFFSIKSDNNEFLEKFSGKSINLFIESSGHISGDRKLLFIDNSTDTLVFECDFGILADSITNKIKITINDYSDVGKSLVDISSDYVDIINLLNNENLDIWIDSDSEVSGNIKLNFKSLLDNKVTYEVV